jgi:hypothetical protein
MIKQPTEEQLKNLTLNVYLKDGREFLGCNVTPKPFGDNENCVSFWQEESLYMVPMPEVKEVVMCFKKT